MAFIPDPSVAIILVNWNGFDFTEACLNSLRRLEFPDFKVILVDNASDNREAKRLKDSFPEIQLIQNNENLGFAGGNNLGIAQAKGEYLLFINNDVEVLPNFLEPLVTCLNSKKNIGMVSMPL